MKYLGESKRLFNTLRQDGAYELARKVSLRGARRLGRRFSWAELDFPLRPEDIASSSEPNAEFTVVSPDDGTVIGRPVDGALHIGWVCSPPGPGSGGHTTLFRMVHALEERGHRCTLFLYDKNSEGVERHEPVIRCYWPEMKADIRSARPAIGGVDAVVASAWASAHVAERRTDTAVPRFYFIQDYEPYFYPRGYLYELAQDSYNLGFIHIALGEMVRKSLVHELSREPEMTIPFGCDTGVYRLLKADGPAASPNRAGVVLYAKTDVHRRGYLLAKAGLELFHQLHPEQEIHVVGDHVTGWRIPVTVHGSLRPQELNALYNRCSAGLALSFTNISLAAEELMAAGCVPVVNDSDLAKADLASPGVVWARPTPTGIAEALASIVEDPHPELQAREVAALPRNGWGISRQQFSSFIESSCLPTVRKNSDSKA